MRDLAIVIPSLGRSEFLSGLVKNVEATTTTSHTIYLVMENTDEDTKLAAENLDTVDVIGDYGSVSHAWNAGYWASEEPFVLVTNDDVRFENGWDLAGLEQMSGPYCSVCGEYRESYYSCRKGGKSEGGVHIVGVNDGHGRMASFLLVRRSYIEKHSGVFDKTNTLVHPYLHQHLDDELAEYAQARGVWGEAPDAVIEHLHPLFGKSDNPGHPNYVRGRQVESVDRAEYQRRKPLWEAAAAAIIKSQ